MNFIGPGFQHMGQPRQTVHGHPRAMGAALAGGAVTGRGRFDKQLAGIEAAQLVHHAVVGGHDEFFGVHLMRRLQNARGGTDRIRQRNHIGRRFGVHQHFGAGVLLH